MLSKEMRLRALGIDPGILDSLHLATARAFEERKPGELTFCFHYSSPTVERISRLPQIEDQADRILRLVSTLEDLVARP